MLFKEGDMADGIYLVKDGELEVSLKHKKEGVDPFRSHFFNSKSIV